MLAIWGIGRFIGNCESFGTHRSSVNSISAFVTSHPRAVSACAIASATRADCWVRL